jgi:hypothetical protein
MSGIPMLDGNEGSRRRAQCHGLPASLLAHIERKMRREMLASGASLLTERAIKAWYSPSIAWA